MLQKRPITELRDHGGYSARNSSKGALIDEAFAVFSSLQSGNSFAETRDGVLSGKLLRQRSGENRRRIWLLIQKRYLSPEISWIRAELCASTADGPESSSFRSLLYLLYAIRDRLTFDFVTQILWNTKGNSQAVVSRNEVLDFLDNASSEQPQIKRWTESTRTKLAGSTLTALRDFGVLEGKQKKYLGNPLLPSKTAEVMIRILVCEGQRGRAVIEDPMWRLFLLSPQDVNAILGKLARNKLIRYEKAGSTVVLDTPAEWEASCAES